MTTTTNQLLIVAVLAITYISGFLMFFGSLTSSNAQYSNSYTNFSSSNPHFASVITTQSRIDNMTNMNNSNSIPYKLTHMAANNPLFFFSFLSLIAQTLFGVATLLFYDLPLTFVDIFLNMVSVLSGFVDLSILLGAAITLVLINVMFTVLRDLGAVR